MCRFSRFWRPEHVCRKWGNVDLCDRLLGDPVMLCKSKVYRVMANIEIRQATGADYMNAVLRLKMNDVGMTRQQAEEFVSNAKAAGFDLSHLWAGFREDGSVSQAAMLVYQPGRTLMLFASAPRLHREIQELKQVVDTALDAYRDHSVAAMQALIDPGDSANRVALEECGFKMMAVLRYMQRLLPKSAPEPVVPRGVEISTWQDGCRDEFIQALNESYRDTQDCPQLHELRTVEDVLDCHLGAGEFDPELWTLVKIDGKPLGVLLLNFIPQNNVVELVYLGLSPVARGRGIAAYLMKRGVWLCTRTGADAITLAVDDENGPAKRLYRRFGFVPTARKTAMFRILDNPAESG